MRLAVLLLLTCGCRQIFGIDSPAHGVDGMVIADAPDASPVVDASPLCFERSDLGLSGCLAAPPMDALGITVAKTLDTDDAAGCAALASSSQPMCVVTATSISIAAGIALRVTGSRPIVLFTQGTISIAGTLDVASHLGSLAFGQPSPGPGENPTVCGTTANGMAAGGGAGGSFATVGGRGGAGGSGNGGSAGPAVALTSFYGGCRGGFSASHDANLTAAAGGGAVAIFASLITIDGTINASGMAGRGGATGSNGGYGGASGGMIVLDAPAVAITTHAEIFAVGGGGGGGATSSGGGGKGQEATSFNSAVPGGASSGNSGTGGSAFPTASPGQNTFLLGDGGGGGGGGNGAILMFTNTPPDAGAQIFPAPRQAPY